MNHILPAVSYNHCHSVCNILLLYRDGIYNNNQVLIEYEALQHGDILQVQDNIILSIINAIFECVGVE